MQGKRPNNGPLTPPPANPRKDKNASPFPDVTSALKLTNARRADRKKKGRVQRNVFLGLVFGAAGSGKTALLQAMIGKRFTHEYRPTAKTISAVSAVEHAGAEKYLVVSLLFCERQ